MKRGSNQNIKITIIGTLIVIVTAIAVGYASFSESLTISGSASVKSSTWSVVFTNISNAYLNGLASEITHPSIDTNQTTVGNYSVSLTAPGDFVGYIVDVENKGTFCAEIETITVPTPTCTGTGNNAAVDAANVCKHLTYTLTDASSNPIETGKVLKTNQTDQFRVLLKYGEEVTAEELPKADVTISNLSVSITYKQSTSDKCN